MTNGYKVIDFKGVSITTDGVAIDGIYNAIDTSDKPLVFSNFVLADVPFKPFFSNPVSVDTSGAVPVFYIPIEIFSEGVVNASIYIDDSDTVALILE